TGRGSRRIDMARASWRGHLRLSLVSCPIYLIPATRRTKSIRLHQVWQPTVAEEPENVQDDPRDPDRAGGTVPMSSPADHREGDDRTRPVSRVVLRPHDPSTGEQVEKEEVVRGYEYERGQFVSFTPGELKALDLESSKVIDLEMFVPRGELDPVYLNS